MKKNKNLKRTLALTAAVLLAAMYVCALIFSFMHNETAQILFRASLACTFLLPVLIYAILLVAKVLRPSKSQFIDAVVLNFSTAETFPEKDAFSGKLIANGYAPFTFPKDGLDFDALAINSVPAKTAYIDDNPENIAKAKKAGFIAIRYSSYSDMINQLSSLGIHLR